MRSLEEGNKLHITDALRQFISADVERAFIAMEDFAVHKVALEIASPKSDLEK